MAGGGLCQFAARVKFIADCFVVLLFVKTLRVINANAVGTIKKLLYGSEICQKCV